MPKFQQVGPEARAKLKTSGSDGRAAYREAIANLDGDQTLEIELEAGETLRGLRVNLGRAAKEVGREIQSGETNEGTLLVWLAQPTQPGRRGRRARAAAPAGTDEPRQRGRRRRTTTDTLTQDAESA